MERILQRFRHRDANLEREILGGQCPLEQRHATQGFPFGLMRMLYAINMKR
jgi:hypothetical protein